MYVQTFKDQHIAFLLPLQLSINRGKFCENVPKNYIPYNSESPRRTTNINY